MNLIMIYLCNLFAHRFKSSNGLIHTDAKTITLRLKVSMRLIVT